MSVEAVAVLVALGCNLLALLGGIGGAFYWAGKVSSTLDSVRRELQTVQHRMRSLEGRKAGSTTEF